MNEKCRDLKEYVRLYLFPSYSFRLARAASNSKRQFSETFALPSYSLKELAKSSRLLAH